MGRHLIAPACLQPADGVGHAGCARVVEVTEEEGQEKERSSQNTTGSAG